jgi:dTDP-4-dehydrorhamnose reductase
VFDGRATEPYKEDDPTGPLNVYGNSKLAGEERVRSANPHHVILRTSWVYSPFGRNFVKTMLRLAEEKDEIAIVADQMGTPTNALDIAEAVLGIVQPVSDGASGTFHFAGRGICSWADVAEAIFSASIAREGPSASVRRISTIDYPTRAVRPAFSALDSGRFHAEFGMSARDWRVAVDEVVGRVVGGA